MCTCMYNIVGHVVSAMHLPAGLALIDAGEALKQMSDIKDALVHVYSIHAIHV